MENSCHLPQQMTPFPSNPKRVSTSSELPGGRVLSYQEVKNLTAANKLRRKALSNTIESLPDIPTTHPQIPGIADEYYQLRIPNPPQGGGIPTTSPYTTQQELPIAIGDEQLQIPGLWNAPQPNTQPLEWKLPQYGLVEGLQKGFARGFEYGVGQDGFRTKSVLTDRAPSAEYDYLPVQGQVGYAAGRIAADWVGHGSRQFIWRAHPEDISSSQSQVFLDRQGGNRIATSVGPYLTGLALGIGSGNYNPLNLGEGGRPKGFQAISPDDEDPRQSTNPVYDTVVERGLFGRKGRLLPWEQFQMERPDVSYQDYAKYKDYLTNKDDNLLRKLTFGMAKGTMDGINGPEVQLMGYSVTPLGIAAATGVLAGTAAGIKRYAKLRK